MNPKYTRGRIKKNYKIKSYRRNKSQKRSRTKIHIGGTKHGGYKKTQRKRFSRKKSQRRKVISKFRNRNIVGGVLQDSHYNAARVSESRPTINKVALLKAIQEIIPTGPSNLVDLDNPSYDTIRDAIKEKYADKVEETIQEVDEVFNTENDLINREIMEAFQRAEAASPRSETLPPGWESSFDVYGQIFYINHNLKQTQWEPPT